MVWWVARSWSVRLQFNVEDVDAVLGNGDRRHECLVARLRYGHVYRAGGDGGDLVLAGTVGKEGDAGAPGTRRHAGPRNPDAVLRVGHRPSQRTENRRRLGGRRLARAAAGRGV